jgi:GTPase-associated protein 1
MSHPQAFHTSCRSGLSGRAGFQFNAASPGLDEQQLSRLAAAHAGYRPAPDAPMEPGPEEIARLPISLRYLPVEGVGPVVSRTAYVGREFRGRGGEPDSGRFGNYFSHIVAAGDEGDPFEGLMPIELWAAPHWSTTESAVTALPWLERIEPGPVDLEWVLGRLLPERAGAMAPVLEACFRSLLEGPRVVLVEPDQALAPAWVAWASFALPADRICDLTFTTFDGRPRVAEAMRVCLTTPACDLAFPPYELGSSVVLVETTATEPARPCLYARVAAALAEAGAEAVAAAVRGLPAGLDLEQAGAALAVLGARADLVAADEAAAVLAALRKRLPSLGSDAAEGLAAALPAEVEGTATLAEWSRLHAAAREAGDPEQRGLVDLTLQRVLAAFSEPGEIEPVAPSAAVAPSVTALAGWSEIVSAADAERLGKAIEAGARLRLVGRNSALDREVAAAIAAKFGEKAVRDAYDSLARAGSETVVEAVALELAALAGNGGSAAPLRHVARHPAARAAVERRAEEDPAFEWVAARELLRVEADPSQRPVAVGRLAELATSERQAELIRALYGEGGPSSPAEHAELLKGWTAAGRNAPPEDYLSALACLAALPLRRETITETLFTALGGPPGTARGRLDYLPWYLLFESPPEGLGFTRWTQVVEPAEPLLRKLPAATLRELRELAAEVAAHQLGDRGYAEDLDALLDVLGPEWLPELGTSLARALERSADPEALLARAFLEWGRPPVHGQDLLEQALPRATRDLPARLLEGVGDRLGERRAVAWEEWLEDHPPSGAVSRAVRGVLRRGEGKR